MVEIGYGSAKIAIFDSGGVLLNKSTDRKAFGDRSLKHLIESLRSVQQETNHFLTKLVDKQTSQNNSENETGVVEEDNADEDDEDEEDESVFPKKRKRQ